MPLIPAFRRERQADYTQIYKGNEIIGQTTTENPNWREREREREVVDANKQTTEEQDCRKEVWERNQK
jgi:hypothetical protein